MINQYINKVPKTYLGKRSLSVLRELTQENILIIYSKSAEKNKEFDKKLLWVPALGVLFGWLIHPNFPNNFHSWWVQNFGVLSTIWAGAVNMKLGHELKPMTTKSMLLVCTTMFIWYYLALFLNFNNRFPTTFCSV